ncbi:MAG TPA: UTRA domain-containing protein [Streptosporangiaceae bacterium]|jgi:GntR family transcriptional regulator|nr:UTRA domain-containing protein [Streptosporangiaceae bacterium]
MTADRGDDAGRAEARRRGISAGVLADRMAATLVHHEPGWRLPRLTALARRYNVSAAEIDAAIDDLAARHLLRRLPDGQVYRVSPAEYRVSLEGLSGLSSHVDPMGGQLVCKTRHVSRRKPPEDIGRSLGLEPGEPVLAIRCLWTVGGEPGALSASYLPARLGDAVPDIEIIPCLDGADQPLPAGPPAAAPAAEAAAAGPAAAGAGQAPGPLWPRRAGQAAAGLGRARAVQIELAPPPPSVARSLRLGAGEPVATVTVSFEDPAAHYPIALTTAMLRPDMFRIVVQAGAPAPPGADPDGLATAWTHTAEGWEP